MTITAAPSEFNQKWYWIESDDGTLMEFAELIGVTETQKFVQSWYKMVANDLNCSVLKITTRKGNGEYFTHTMYKAM